MRAPTVSMPRLQQEVVYLTGGLNEEVSSLQLKSGELISCVNYQEISGQYSGYTSIGGFERVNGMGKASDVPTVTTIDYGIDGDVILLGEGESNIVDLSLHSYDIISNGVVLTTTRYKNGSSSFLFPQSSTLTILHAPALSLVGDFCWEGYIFIPAGSANGTLFEKAGEYKVVFNTTTIDFHCSTDGVTYDTVVPSSSIQTNRWFHYAVQNISEDIYVSINGSLGLPTTLATPIIPSTGDLVFGSTTLAFNMDQVRLSSKVRYPIDFVPPASLFSLRNEYFYELVDDRDRETQRALIEALPGSGRVAGIAYYKDTLYGWREDSATVATRTVMYKGTSAGWVEVVQPTGYGFAVGSSIFTVQYRFESFSTNDMVMVIVDGASIPRIFDGTTTTMLTSAELPDNQITPKYASLCGAYDNRLFLGYSEGSVIFSDVGDPTNYSSITASAGELFLGSPITNITEAPGNVLVVACESFIKIIKSVLYEDTLWAFQVETFSRSRGSKQNTARSILGTVYFADHDGIVSLESSSTYGSMESAVITSKVQTTYLANRDAIVGCLVNEKLSQYLIYFNTGDVLILTFDLEKRVKGATKLSYGKNISYITEGPSTTRDTLRFFVSPTGYVYEFDSGTSFDGEVINTQLTTAYYHYKTPRIWKYFKRIVFEGTGELGTKIGIRLVFDYNEPNVPTMPYSETTTSTSSSSKYGEILWGAFIWGASAASRIVYYLTGYGTNMGVQLRTSSKYKKQHTLHNFIVDFTSGPKQV